MKRDVINRLDEMTKSVGLTKRGTTAGLDTTAERESLARNDGSDNGPRRPEVWVAVDLDRHEEPTWEVRQPDACAGNRRLDGRTRSILSVAAVAAVVVNAGAAWAYWKVTASETGSARAGAIVELTMRGRSDLNRPLTPGGTGNLTVTLTNDHDFPIRITSVAPAMAGNVIADDEHRDAGCIETGVSITKSSFVVAWDVAKNTIGAFTVPDGLRMAPHANRACVGATFTVPVQTAGVREG